MAENTEGSGVRGATAAVEVFEPDQVRAWRYHNRAESGMDEASLDALAESIRRDGQQQPGLARRLPAGGAHVAEVVFGVRRLEACRRAGVPWRAEVRDATTTDAECASLMHAENEWTEGVSPLENALQWRAMLDAGVFRSQTALADALGCHRGTVSRGMRTVEELFGEEWIERLVRPVMHEFSVRSAERLANALADGANRAAARRRAQDLVPGTVGANAIHDALFGARRRERLTVYERRGANTGRGPVTARIQRDGAGAWSVSVRTHRQTPSDMAELAEKVEGLLAVETAPASGVRLGRRLVAMVTAQEARNADQGWLEGLVYAAARASGLDWDRWQCMSAARLLRDQQDGWERAIARASGGRGADPGGAEP